MSIRALCSICRVTFNNTCNVTALCCGHLYHQECVQQWFYAAARRTCPQCRTVVGSSRDIVQKLFFELVEGDPEELRNEVDRANARLLSKERELTGWFKAACSLYEEVNEKKAELRALEKNFWDMTNSYSGLEEQLRLLYQEQAETKAVMERTIGPAIFERPSRTGYQRPKLRQPGEFVQKTLSFPAVSVEATGPTVFGMSSPIGIQRAKLRPPHHTGRSLP